MRITNQLMNFNNVYNYQKNSNSLYQSQQAFSTGLKINYAYEGSGIYVDAARLEYESNLLKQVESTTLKATEFSKNSDKALNDFVLKLTEFKTKLIQAANDIHDATSRNAIANDLEGIKQNLIDIANTTINGQYLFSGTALDTMPIDDLGNYNGNAESIKAVIGTNQTSNYNINGQSLFLGSDNDYKKVITTNVNLVNNYNKFANPDEPIKYVELGDDLRDLIGENYRSEEFNKANPPKEDDFKEDAVKDQPTTFFLQGRKPDGSTFSTKVTMTPNSSIQSLLDNIGYALGNDKDGKNPLVQVTLNNSGQIEITDIRNGNQMMELHLFGLTPQQSTEKYKVGDYEINIDPATSGNYKITTTKDADGNITEIIATHNQNNQKYTINLNNNQLQVNNQTVQNIGNPPFALDLNDLGANGIDANDFTAFDPNNAEQVKEMSSTKVRDKDGSWVDVSDLTDLETIEENVKNGKVYLTEFIKSDFKDTLGVKNDATDYNKLQFAQKDNILTGSVSQVVKGKNTFATDATKLKDVAGAGLQDNPDSNMTMHIKSKNGNYYEVKIQFTDPVSASDPKATSLRIQEVNQDGTPKTDAQGNPVQPVYQGNIMLGKYNEATQKTDGVVTSANDISYKQINDIVAMVAAGNMPEDDISTQIGENFNNIYEALLPPPAGAGFIPNPQVTLKAELTAGINDPELETKIEQIVDEVLAANGGNADLNTLGEIKDKIINDPTYATGRFEAYNKAVDAASASVNVELNYRGQMQITDKSSTATNIEVTIFEEFEGGEFAKGENESKRGSLFNFTANNMISIDEPSVDIFKDLDAMIAAVRDGSYRGNPDGTNARTTGIQGALKRIDHIQDHVNKLHTQIGSYTNVLESSNSRASMLYVNVESIKNDVIGADLGESMLIYKQYLTQFEAMLQTSSMISKISLLNYM